MFGGEWLTRNGMFNFILFSEPANHIDAGDKRRHKIIFFIVPESHFSQRYTIFLGTKKK